MLINVIWMQQHGYITTFWDYVNSFKRYSRNEVIYTNITNINLNADIIVLHNSIMHILVNNQKLKELYIKHLVKYEGKKVAIIQDEYYDVNLIKSFLEKINIDLVLTCIPDKNKRDVYNNIPNARIERVLTGYVPEKMSLIQPIKNREIFIFYRGKNLPYYYGKLGQWKQNIGKKMFKYCETNKIDNINIAWREQDKIFGKNWLKTMQNSKVTLATPSGLNVFHYDNSKIYACLKKERTMPNYTYEMAEKEFNLQDGPIKMGQISPKMFEAAMCGTVLVMYPGTYNGIFKKDVHYIELQPDFSNIEEVMKKIKNDEFLQEMSDRTYKDIVESNKYSYETFISKVDRWLDEI